MSSLVSRPLAFAIALGLTTIAQAAFADVAPPPGYVETCTLDKQSKPGSECHACEAFYGNHTHCSDSLASYGFAQQCRTNGASVWSEVWCRAKGPSAPKVPSDVIAQLSNANNKVTPGPTLASPPTAPTGAPQPASSAKVDAPAPPPVPPPRGCGCNVIGDGGGPLAASFFAALTAVIVAVRRRRA